MIFDVTGVELIPGNHGKHCPGNGLNYDEFDLPIECCCDECDYFLCCYGPMTDQECLHCTDTHCPHASKQ